MNLYTGKPGFNNLYAFAVETALILPQLLPAPSPKGHLGKSCLFILFNAALLPVSALSINRGLAREQIRLLRPDEPGVPFAVVRHVADRKHHGRKRQRKVPRYKAAHVEWDKHVVADKDQHRGHQEQCPYGRIWCEGRGVWQRFVGDALGHAGTVKGDVGDEHKGKGGEKGGGGQVDEPQEDLNGRVGRNQESDAGDEGDDANAVDRDARLGALEQETRGLAVYGSQYINSLSKSMNILPRARL